MKNSNLFLMTIAIVSLLGGCSNDLNELKTPTPISFEIVSNDYRVILSRYENGWIKEAVEYYSENTPATAYGYYEDGSIQYVKKYYITPNNSLQYEHERDNRGYPLQTKYYRYDGGLHVQFDYIAGQLSQKTQYTNHVVNIERYEDGLLQTVEQTNLDGLLRMKLTYDYNAKTKHMKVFQESGELYEEVYDMHPAMNIGGEYNGETPYETSYNTNSFYALKSLVSPDNYQLSETGINATTQYSIQPHNSLEGVGLHDIQYIPSDLRLEVNLQEAEKLITSNLFRGLYEQYEPMADQRLFVAKYSTIDKQYTFPIMGLYITEEAKLLKMEQPDLFRKIYGDHHLQAYQTGVNIWTVGVVRNLPSDTKLRERILAIAEKYFRYIISERIPITEEEKDMLSKVFVELKVHTEAFGNAGLAVENHESYITALAEATEKTYITWAELRMYPDVF